MRAAHFNQLNQLLDDTSLSMTHTGDSDSTGASCGNLLGSLHSEQSLLTQPIDYLEGLPTIRELGDGSVGDSPSSMSEPWTPTDQQKPMESYFTSSLTRLGQWCSALSSNSRE